ncbi:MAG: hypothetical protein PUC12_12255 [Clostridiales bacterium]|nr:hypothetical protein [Clostridiales bacterium]
MNGKQGLKKALVLYCGIYTVATIVNSVLYLANGVYEDPNGNLHELTRAVMVLIGTIAYAMAFYLPVKNSLLKAAAIYLPTMGLVFFLVFLSGLVETLSKNAYRDIFFNYTGCFLVVSVVAVLVRRAGKKKLRS